MIYRLSVNVSIAYLEADTEWVRLRDRRDQIMASGDATGFTDAQNALADRSLELERRCQDEAHRAQGRV